MSEYVESDTTVLRELRRVRRERRLGDTEWFDVLYRVYLFALVGTIAVVVASDSIDGLIDEQISADLILERGPSIAGVVVVLAFSIGLRNGSEGGTDLNRVGRRAAPYAGAEQPHLGVVATDHPTAASSRIRTRTRARRPWTTRRPRDRGVTRRLGSQRCTVRRAHRFVLCRCSSGCARTASPPRGGLVGGNALCGMAVTHSMEDLGGRSHRVGADRARQSCRKRSVLGYSTADDRPHRRCIGVPICCVCARVGRSTAVAVARTARTTRIATAFRSDGPGYSHRRSPSSTTQRRVGQVDAVVRAAIIGSTNDELHPRCPRRHARPRPVPGPITDRFPTYVWRRGLASIRRLPLSRLVRMVSLAIIAGISASLTVTSSWLFLILLVAAGFLLGLEAVEPLAQEVDRPDLTGGFPEPRGWLFAHHMVAPAVLLAVAAMIGAGGSSVAQPPPCSRNVRPCSPRCVGGSDRRSRDHGPATHATRPTSQTRR